MSAFKTEPKGTLLDDSIRNLSLLKARYENAKELVKQYPEEHQPLMLVLPKTLLEQTIIEYPGLRANMMRGLNANELEQIKAAGL